MLTGRRFSGEDALRYGLATEVSENPLADALAMAVTVAQKNLDAVRAGMATLNDSALVDVATGLAPANMSVMRPCVRFIRLQ